MSGFLSCSQKQGVKPWSCVGKARPPSRTHCPHDPPQRLLSPVGDRRGGGPVNWALVRGSLFIGSHRVKQGGLGASLTQLDRPSLFTDVETGPEQDSPTVTGTQVSMTPGPMLGSRGSRGQQAAGLLREMGVLGGQPPGQCCSSLLCCLSLSPCYVLPVPAPSEAWAARGPRCCCREPPGTFPAACPPAC